MRSLLIASVLAASSAAGAQPTFAVAAHGSALDLAFTNPTKAPLTMATHVRAGIDHYDWLSVELANASTHRTLSFVEARDKSVRVDETIAPGATLVRRVDLAAWAIREGNNIALAPGDYDVVATWDTSALGCDKKCAKLVAKTKITIAAPVEKRCADPWNATPRRESVPLDVELLAHQLAGTPMIEVGIHNGDAVAHCVVAYVATHETQSDWLSIQLDGKRTLRFDDSRDKSAIVTVELAPGATVWGRWDVAAWAKRDRNGKTPLAAGTTMWATIRYDAAGERDALAVTLTTAIGIRIP
jgi:hypothetical protein